MITDAGIDDIDSTKENMGSVGNVDRYAPGIFAILIQALCILASNKIVITMG